MNVPPPPNYPPNATLRMTTAGQKPPARSGQKPANNPKDLKDGARTNAFLNALGKKNEAQDVPARDDGPAGGHVPGSDFMSNEDIQAYCEFRRKAARNGATELAMDADHLEAVLRTIPDSTGSRTGSRARARRVSRWLKKAAAAEKAQQKYFAAVYATFEREFEAELRTISRGRARQNQRAPFGWH